MKHSYNSYDYPVLPLRGYVKGNTIDKIAKSAAEFFCGSEPSGGIIVKKFNGTFAVLFTAGSGKAMAKAMIKDNAIVCLNHDQTQRHIADVQVVGSFEYNQDGKVTSSYINSANEYGDFKISGSYTFK